MYSGALLLFYSCFAALLFIAENIRFHIAATACVVTALMFVPFRRVKGGFLPISLFLGFTFVSNLFYQSGEVIAVAGPVTVTDEGLRIAALRALRVFELVYAAKILTYAVPLEAMIASLKNILQPLQRIGLPVHEFFSITALTLRCFPVIKQKLYERYGEAMRHRMSAASSGGILLSASRVTVRRTSPAVLVRSGPTG